MTLKYSAITPQQASNGTATLLTAIAHWYANNGFQVNLSATPVDSGLFTMVKLKIAKPSQDEKPSVIKLLIDYRYCQWAVMVGSETMVEQTDHRLFESENPKQDDINDWLQGLADTFDYQWQYLISE